VFQGRTSTWRFDTDEELTAFRELGIQLVRR
jgi:hypothetical protein